MKKHVKIYLSEMGYDATDFIPCELCGRKSDEIHHISPKGLGGSKKKDNIENLAAVCRDCHIEAHKSPKVNKAIKEKHRTNLIIKQIITPF